MRPSLATLAGADAFDWLCQEALSAANAAGQRRDSESLHDFRVAVRRLRMVVNHYGGDAPRLHKVARRLKRLTNRSNDGRDHEVLLGWLEQQWPQLREGEWYGARYWRRELRRVALPSMASLVRQLRPVAKLLAASPVSEPWASSRFGSLVAHELERERQTLLGLMQNSAAASELHRLRLQVKRVRYLLMPFREELEACRTAEQQLQELQERLGVWHDSVVCHQSLHKVMAARMRALGRDTTQALRQGKPLGIELQAPSLPGLVALMRLNLSRQETMRISIMHDYLADGGAQLDAQLQLAVAALYSQAAKG